MDHALGQVLPLVRRMTSPTTLSMTDRNGVDHECVAEAFKTPWNVFILLYPIGALTRSTIVLPANIKPAAGSLWNEVRLAELLLLSAEETGRIMMRAERVSSLRMQCHQPSSESKAEIGCFSGPMKGARRFGANRLKHDGKCRMATVGRDINLDVGGIIRGQRTLEEVNEELRGRKGRPIEEDFIHADALGTILGFRESSRLTALK